MNYLDYTVLHLSLLLRERFKVRTQWVRRHHGPVVHLEATDESSERIDRQHRLRPIHDIQQRGPRLSAASNASAQHPMQHTNRAERDDSQQLFVCSRNELLHIGAKRFFVRLLRDARYVPPGKALHAAVTGVRPEAF